VCPHLTWTGGGVGRGIDPVLTFFWTRRGQFFMILCRRPLWMFPEQKKKIAKLSMDYRPTNSHSYIIDSLYRVCITDKESTVIYYHDYL